MDDVNAQQKQAATTTDGPLVIIAGPGTGKTKTLVTRLEFLAKNGVPAGKILALTFTKKAAEEMTARAKVPAVISTFHALCFVLLKEKTGELPIIISEPARLALIKKMTKPAAFKGVSTRELSLLISRAKNMADGYANAQRLVAAYDAEMRAQNACDFDDILLQTKDFLEQDAARRTQIQTRFTHIMVDEFQDTNTLQYQLLRLIAGTKNICVIGDPQQSIYGFRGADGNIFDTFLRDFPHAKRVTLQTNYRSAPQIVDVANAVYSDAPALSAHNKTPGVARAVEVLNEFSEANWVLNEIQSIIGGSDLLRAKSDDARANQRGLRDIAVLYRSRNVARTVQKTLADSGIPTQIVGDGSPYDAPNTQAIIQILAQLFDPSRTANVKDFSPTQISALLTKIDATKTPHVIAEQIIQAFGIEPDGDVRQLVSVLVQHKNLADAVAYFDDIAAHDFYDPRAEAVTLLTIHAAKGLEFAHVFLIAAEDGVLPSDRGDKAEEKRLFYVAVTRAKERLDVLHARVRGGQKAHLSPSVQEIPAVVLPRITDTALLGDERRAQKRQAKRSQTSLF